MKKNKFALCIPEVHWKQKRQTTRIGFNFMQLNWIFLDLLCLHGKIHAHDSVYVCTSGRTRSSRCTNLGLYNVLGIIWHAYEIIDTISRLCSVTITISNAYELAKVIPQLPDDWYRIWESSVETGFVNFFWKQTHTPLQITRTRSGLNYALNRV